MQARGIRRAFSQNALSASELRPAGEADSVIDALHGAENAIQTRCLYCLDVLGSVLLHPMLRFWAPVGHGAPPFSSGTGSALCVV